MRNFYTVVLERMKEYSESFATEPYETGWAREAMFFIRVHEIPGGGTSLNAKVQVSVDGITWIDEGTVFPPITKVGDYFIRVTHFGGWLRLHNEISGKGSAVKLTEHLVLKE